MQFSSEARCNRLKLNRKQVWVECNNRGRKISYGSVCTAINSPGELLYTTEKLVIDTISEIESERGMTDIEF